MLSRLLVARCCSRSDDILYLHDALFSNCLCRHSVSSHTHLHRFGASTLYEPSIPSVLPTSGSHPNPARMKQARFPPRSLGMMSLSVRSLVLSTLAKSSFSSPSSGCVSAIMFHLLRAMLIFPFKPFPQAILKLTETWELWLLQ